MMFAKDLKGNHPRADANWAKLQEPTENVLDGHGFGHATGVRVACPFSSELSAHDTRCKKAGRYRSWRVS